MQEITVARNYAEALFELASADGEPELYGEALSQFVSVIEAERDFRLFLETPLLEPRAKKEVIGEVFGGRIPDRVLHFLYVLIDKRRARVLPQIAEEFAALVDEHFGRLLAEITIAAEPDEALKVDLRERLGSLLEREVIPRYRVNPRIIGGVIVKVGDRIMDGSVRHRLQMLRRSLLRAEVD